MPITAGSVAEVSAAWRDFLAELPLFRLLDLGAEAAAVTLGKLHGQLDCLLTATRRLYESTLKGRACQQLR